VNPARRIVLAPIAVYQRLISPALPRRCKYEPTC
jgi:putative component of membrane protein insertase Oxa1/YidC/SpoIIIJ protein YidD